MCTALSKLFILLIALIIYLVRGLFNNYVMLSCLYPNFRWIISYIQLSFQPLSVNILCQRVTEGTRTLAPVHADLTRRVNEAEVRPISYRYVIIDCSLEGR